MKNSIYILGGGGHAKVIISILKSLNNYTILGYVDIIDRGTILGVNYSQNDEDLLQNEGVNLVVGLSYGNNIYDSQRERVIRKFENHNFIFPVIISPSALLKEEVEIGRGTVIMDNSLINPSCNIGEFCIINSRVIIEHDVQVGSFSQISPGGIICGDVQIGKNCFIGAWTVINDGISVVKCG
ncbi:acetyltransferase [Ignavibacteriales bacterium]